MVAGHRHSHRRQSLEAPPEQETGRPGHHRDSRRNGQRGDPPGGGRARARRGIGAIRRGDSVRVLAPAKLQRIVVRSGDGAAMRIELMVELGHCTLLDLGATTYWRGGPADGRVEQLLQQHELPDCCVVPSCAGAAVDAADALGAMVRSSRSQPKTRRSDDREGQSHESTHTRKEDIPWHARRPIRFWTSQTHVRDSSRGPETGSRLIESRKVPV